MGKCNKRVLNLSFAMKNSYSKKMKTFFKNALRFWEFSLTNLRMSLDALACASRGVWKENVSGFFHYIE